LGKVKKLKGKIGTFAEGSRRKRQRIKRQIQSNPYNGVNQSLIKARRRKALNRKTLISSSQQRGKAISNHITLQRVRREGHSMKERWHLAFLEFSFLAGQLQATKSFFFANWLILHFLA